MLLCHVERVRIDSRANRGSNGIPHQKDIRGKQSRRQSFHAVSRHKRIEHEQSGIVKDGGAAANCMSSVLTPSPPVISLMLHRYAPPEKVGGTNSNSNSMF